MTKKKATLTTRPVAWVEEKPTKYQSFLEYPITEERTLRLMGDPKNTETAALDSLYAEFNFWEEAMVAFKMLL